jgi:hypothetical protein
MAQADRRDRGRSMGFVLWHVTMSIVRDHAMKFTAERLFEFRGLK